MLAITMALWSCSRSFAIHVKHTTQQLKRCRAQGYLLPEEFHARWIDIDKHYRALQELFSLANETFGPLYLMFVIVDILFYSTNFNHAFVRTWSGDWSAAVKVLILFVFTAVIFNYAANIATQIEQLNEFLCLTKPSVLSQDKFISSGKQCSISSDHFLMYAIELNGNAVSIKAGNVFPITYSLVANVSTYLYKVKAFNFDFM